MLKINLILLLFSTFAYSQQEASTWYFGQNGGLKFHADGSVSALSDGLLSTTEGCSAISDVNGNLLFYTDGRTVWDKNHIVMPNGNYFAGTGMYGDPSSTQSGIIVPKPGSPNIYYIFTVDEPHHENALVYPAAFSGNYESESNTSTPQDDDGLNHGFNYSVVDLSIIGNNGSIGDIISLNNHLVTYNQDPSGEEIKYKCSEKVTAIKNEQTGEYWVITHFRNKFYAFRVSSTGISAPVISVIGPDVILQGYRRNAIGYLKASPNGNKLAVAHSEFGTILGSASLNTGKVLLYDFNKFTGVISAEKAVIEDVQSYGVEFSAQSKKLYATYRNGTTNNLTLAQFDIQSLDILNSKVILYDGSDKVYALQLGINNKIYCAKSGASSLGVINSPEQSGTLCDYAQEGQALSNGTTSQLGLPPFITSFFNVSFNVQNLCLGYATNFSIIDTQGIISVSWDFGDGMNSGEFNPGHVYASAGTYQVVLSATSNTGTSNYTRDITIFDTPVANTVQNQFLCSPNYLLDSNSSNILGAQSADNFGILYFNSNADALANINMLPNGIILNSGTTTFFAKVYNLQNPNCYDITNFSVTAFNTPQANLPQNYFLCDDTSNDGFGVFDLNSVSSEILGSQDPIQYPITYYHSQSEADNKINHLSLNYQNLNNPETIYARIENSQNPNCYNTVSFLIGVYTTPIITNVPDLFLCDDESHDGVESFNLDEQNLHILGTQSPTSFTITYHSSQQDANSGANPILSNYHNTTNPEIVFARIVNNLSLCFNTASFTLNVKTPPILNMEDTYALCEGKAIDITIPPGFTSYTWSNGETGNSLHITQPGNYSVDVSKDYGDITCNAVKNFIVYNSNAAIITGIQTDDWTDNDNRITVSVIGDGIYEYSLDNINYQDSPEFTNLISGIYTVYVRDKRGCGTVDDEALLLMYPKFFTPNLDGFNDYWNIKFSRLEPELQVSIFDRYGKLLVYFPGTSFGWDGTYNGNPLPSDDYWFHVKRKDGKEYRGHFSLKR